ncbi:adenylate kinase family enzyme [Bacillus benzoevorans]|uniref:Adenylate kinase family enzyme n=2 Tax=Bacillus benzoevorans TaxID=1456 RepID=A0A7X0HMS5_9BACI|nr:adenylate kinase family enzyme [Bacillus benzoevorans]
MMASTLLLMTACENKEQADSLSLASNSKQIVFFSDEEEYEEEISYYNAIIELKKEYPEEIKNMKVLTASEVEEYYNTFRVNHCPAILVYYHNHVIVQIQGDAETRDIINPIANALSRN